MSDQNAIFDEGAQLLRHIQSRTRSPLQWLLDTSVFYSFDASGLSRHRRAHMRDQRSRDASNDLNGSRDHYLITGANSGLGFALADQLMERGAAVSMICRNPERGRMALERLRERHNRAPQLYLADLTDLQAIDSATEEIKDHINKGSAPPITCLVHNAGLLPLELELTSTGHELTVGAHLIGPARLTARLMPALADPARIIFMSSGGMYTAPLSVDQMLTPPSSERYDGVHAYALTKRAQVELSRVLHQRLQRQSRRTIDVQSAHPGWADTPGVSRSLATFHEKMSGRLRTSDEGAEAVTWLCTLPPLPTSEFWFDWTPRSPYLLGKRPKDHERERLWDAVCQGAQLDRDWYLS